MSDYKYRYKADTYDQEVKEYGNYLHDLLFGLSFEYVNAGETILDIGIGTGLASINFSKIGLKVYGLDNSEDMLKICSLKLFTQELKLHNLLTTQIPYPDNYFNHVISCGVFHFFNDLEFVFKEAARILKINGMFAFTFAVNDGKSKYIKLDSSWNVPVFLHSLNYIYTLLHNNGLRILKEQKILLKSDLDGNYDLPFFVCIAKYF